MLDTAAKNAKLDTLYPASSALGYAILLDTNANLQSAIAVTLDNSTDTFTSGTTIKMITGSRIRLGGTFPSVASGAAIDGVTDYFVIKLTSTTFKLARTLADALVPTPIDFTSDGSSLTYTEQQLLVTDPLNVLINKELTHTSYTRKNFDSLSSASGGSKTFVWTIAVSGSTMSYRHRLIILGGSSTLGDTTGTKDEFITESTDIDIASGNTGTFGITFTLTATA